LGFLVWFAIVTIPVALFEEISFRGALLLSLTDWLGKRAAVWVSSLAFMVFHVQAQPLSHWPNLGLFGLVFAILRTKGVSILWLAGIHWVYDSDWFSENPGDHRLLLRIAALLLAALLAFACSTMRPVSGPERRGSRREERLPRRIA
jgi:membrane protease YdiL (CAAX protease family)